MSKEDFKKVARKLCPKMTDAEFETQWRIMLNLRRRRIMYGLTH